MPVLVYDANFDFRDGAYGAYYWLPLLGAPYNGIADKAR